MKYFFLSDRSLQQFSYHIYHWTPATFPFWQSDEFGREKLCKTGVCSCLQTCKMAFKKIFSELYRIHIFCTAQSHRKRKQQITKIGRAKFDCILKIGSEFMVNSTAKRSALQLAESTSNLHTMQYIQRHLYFKKNSIFKRYSFICSVIFLLNHIELSYSHPLGRPLSGLVFFYTCP